MPQLLTLPFTPQEPLPTITPWSSEAIGPDLVMAAPTTVASATWPAASRALYVPFMLAAHVSIDRMFTYNGATASNSIDVGLYAEDGTRLVSKGLTLQSGTSVLQLFTFAAAVLLGPGRYYMALSMNGTTGTFQRTAGPTAEYLRGAGVSQEDLSGAGTPGTLPATATFAVPASAYTPVFGLVRTGFTI